MSITFENLMIDRQGWVDSNRKNKFESGIKKLLTELYPDNAHFIYELLQNAEDAGASSVTFELEKDRVKFTHNGSKLFTIDDVESITSIGESTKKDDPTNIGKFGVGFKAVFSYTDTPEIHSGNFHFRIRDLVVPETEEVEEIEVEGSKTLFIFPFNHPEKPQSQAFSEIKKGLNELSNNTLIFLKNIKKIEYIDTRVLIIERVEYEDNFIEISTKFKESEYKTTSRWLRYEKEVIVKDNIKRRIAIAYKIEGNKIIPLDRGRVFIYFPAAKEESNLKFHIHAPFASTVARDSVRDCEDNNFLRDKISGLIVESLEDIKEKGLLTTNFLSVMPNPNDNLSLYYEPIRLAIINKFNTTHLTPTLNGKHDSASKLYRSYPKKISDVLGKSGLVFFTDDKFAQWCANPNQINQREDKFLDSLNIKPFGWKELSILFKNKSQNNKSEVGKYIYEKDDYSLLQLYAILGEAYSKNDIKIKIDFNVVRIEQGKHESPMNSFLPTSKSSLKDDSINYVSKTIYNPSDTHEKNSYVRLFLKYIGVRDYDIEYKVDSILEEYKNKKEKTIDEHIKDLNIFIEYFKVNTLKQSKFMNIKFIKSENDTIFSKFNTPKEIFIDEPYKKTFLSSAQNIHNKKLLWNRYRNEFSEQYLEVFLKLVNNCGSMFELEIEEIEINRENPKYSYLREDVIKNRKIERETKIDRDFYVKDLEKYILARDINVSKIIWNMVINAKSEISTAIYKPNKKAEQRSSDSYVVYMLKKHAWIPDKFGDFYTPQSVIISNLHPDFECNDDNGVLLSIGFRESVKNKKSLDFENNKKAHELGFDSIDEAEDLQQLRDIIKQTKNMSIKDYIAEISRKEIKYDEFPIQNVKNKERRERELEGNILEAPDTEYGQKSLKVKTSDAATRFEAKQMLKSFYTNEHNVMLCQICEEEMAFRKLAKDNHEYYFETVEIFRGDYFKKEHRAKYIALCPVCAAKYNYFIKKNYNIMDELKEIVRNFEGNRYTLPIEFGKEMASIRFVEKHFFDLTNILKFNK